MQNFFFDRRSRKRNRRTDTAEQPEQPEQAAQDERRQGDRRQHRASTLEHYYAVHDMEVEDFSDLESRSESESGKG